MAIRLPLHASQDMISHGKKNLLDAMFTCTNILAHIPVPPTQFLGISFFLCQKQKRTLSLPSFPPSSLYHHLQPPFFLPFSLLFSFRFQTLFFFLSNKQALSSMHPTIDLSIVACKHVQSTFNTQHSTPCSLSPSSSPLPSFLISFCKSLSFFLYKGNRHTMEFVA
jgi:hypothetical protein